AADESFLVRFGGTEAADWSGSLEVEGGALVALGGWQLDEGDSVDFARRSWTARTVVETYWDAPWERSLQGTKQKTKLSERGLIVRLSSGTARVRLETPAGEVELEPASIGWQRPVLRLNGLVRIERTPVVERIESTAGPD